MSPWARERRSSSYVRPGIGRNLARNGMPQKAGRRGASRAGWGWCERRERSWRWPGGLPPALPLAADLIADEVENLTRDIEAVDADIVLVDTPGQMELFAFRASGPYIVDELTREPKAIVYLFDAVFSINPLNYVSNMFLSAAVYNRFLHPQIHLLSKIDLIPKKEVERITEWSSNPRALDDSIEQKLEDTKRLFSRNMMHAINQLGLKFLLIPVSAKTNEGLINFNTSLERILTQGEKYTT